MDTIVERILDSDKWPCISNPENLEILNEMADAAFKLQTFDGMVSATLIYHQMSNNLELKYEVRNWMNKFLIPNRYLRFVDLDFSGISAVQ